MSDIVVPENIQPTNQTPPIQVKIKKRLVFWVAGILLLLSIIGAVLWNTKKQDMPTVSQTKTADVIATVNENPVYKTYIDTELEYYPGTKSPEVEKTLKQKVIDDEITLQEGVKQGWIKDYPKDASLSESEYLKRTDLVKQMKANIENRGNFIKGKTVMVWFYNNGYIGSGGIEASKKIAYSKIKPLYDQVASKKITIEQAGEIIKNDKSIKAIDPAWESNALAPFTYYKNGTATFWPEYNQILWKTNPGELTPLYVGGGILRDGKPMEELYIFSLVEKKSTNNTYSDYNEWIEQKRKDTKIGSAGTNFFQYVSLSKVFAQEESGGGNESNQSSNSDDNNGNTGRSGVWYGTVTTRTGAPISGASVRILTGCNRPNGRTETTDGAGRYNTGVDYNLSCLCNPQYGSVTYNGLACDVVTPIHKEPDGGLVVPNGDVTIPVDFVCGPPPPPTATPLPTATPVPPTPTPLPACGTVCTSPFACQAARDGCTACVPNAAGTQSVCAPPPACGNDCVRDDQCAGSKEGCTVCQPNADGKKVCSPPPACGLKCAGDYACVGAKDGCTSCIENDTNTEKTCKPAPACGTACTKDSQCAGAKNGCTMCTAGKCSSFSEDMCSCDGMAFTGPNGSETFFPGDNVTFIAYGKVPGKDWKGDPATTVKSAEVTSMTFALYQSKLSDPNTATLIAQSAAITPQVVESSDTKVRYKVTWDKQIPATVPAGTLYRIQAKLKCSAKPGVLGAATRIGATNYFMQLYDVVSGMFAKGSVLGEATRNDQHADTFFPGAQVQERTCTFIKFFFN